MNEFPQVVHRFFFLFSRFEYAIKQCGWINKDSSANWDQFARNLGRDFFMMVVDRRVAPYLIAHPPRKQIAVPNNGGRTLGWANSRTVSDNASLFGAIRIVRNNLFHGGKFIHGFQPDVARDERLLEECNSVLEAALNEHAEVARAFNDAG